MLTTGAMTRLGHVYGNLMVNVSPKNKKLVERAVTILSQAAGVNREEARAALGRSGNHVPIALIMLTTGVTRGEAGRRLKSARGNVRRAIEASGSAKPSVSRSSPPRR
jgi:N-acetylmuramic acid 6-phosphate etherase